MDKYEFNIKVEQIKKMVTKEDFQTAMKIADTIDWRRVRNANLLSTISQVYEKNRDYQEAKEVLLLAFERAPIGKRFLYKLTELALKEGNMREAEDYCTEFCQLAPEDTRQHILRYLILKGKKASLDQLIQALERYINAELDEKWMYELAELYAKAGRSDDCVRLCDKMTLLFGIGTYVEKAAELRQRYAPSNSYPRRQNPISAQVPDLAPGGYNGYGDIAAQTPEVLGYGGNWQDAGNPYGTAAQNYGAGVTYEAELGYVAAGGYEAGYGAGNHYEPEPGYAAANGYGAGNGYEAEPGYVAANGYEAGYGTGNRYEAEPSYAAANGYGAGNGYEAEPGYAAANGYEAGYGTGNRYEAELGRVAANGYEMGYGTENRYESEPGYIAVNGYEAGYGAGNRYEPEPGHVTANGYESDYGAGNRCESGPGYSAVNGYESGYGTVGSYGATPAPGYGYGGGSGAGAPENGYEPQAVPVQSVYGRNGNYSENDVYLNGAAYENREGYGGEGGYGDGASYGSGSWQEAPGGMAQERTAGYGARAYGGAYPQVGYRSAGPYVVDAEMMADLHQAAAEKELAAEMSRISTEEFAQPESVPTQTRVFRGKNNIRIFRSRYEEEKPFYNRSYMPNHMIVEAETAQEGLEIAVEALKQIHQETGVSNSVIKIAGSKLSKRGIINVSDKLAGKDLIVEEAGNLTQRDLEELQTLLERDETGMIVVLIDNQPHIESLHQQNPGFINLFKCISAAREEQGECVQEESGLPGREPQPQPQPQPQTQPKPQPQSQPEPEQKPALAPEMSQLEADPQPQRAMEPAQEPEQEPGIKSDVESEAEPDAGVMAQPEPEAEERENQEEQEVQEVQESELPSERETALEDANDGVQEETQSDVEEEGDGDEESPEPEDDEPRDESQPDEESYEEARAEEETYDEEYRDPESIEDDEELGIEEFTEYAVQYASEIDCSITGKSLLALCQCVDKLEEDGIPLTKANAEEMIEDAADRAEKPSLGGLIKGVFSSKYDKEGLLILKEEHFL